MSNLGLERYLEGIGLGLVRTPVGDRYVVEHMRKHGYNVGGEQSGHIVLSDFSTTGDGLVTALAAARRGGAERQAGQRDLQPFRAAAADPQECALREAASRSTMRASARRSSNGKSKLGESGRLVIRPSGTEPVIRVMAEGDDERLVKTVVGDIVHALTDAAA